MWKELMNELRPVLTDEQIADETGLSISTVSRMRSGKIAEPKYKAGKTLIDLHRRYLPNSKLQKEGISA